jgi:hypothetical protein
VRRRRLAAQEAARAEVVARRLAEVSRSRAAEIVAWRQAFDAQVRATATAAARAERAEQALVIALEWLDRPSRARIAWRAPRTLAPPLPAAQAEAAAARRRELETWRSRAECLAADRDRLVEQAAGVAHELSRRQRDVQSERRAGRLAREKLTGELALANQQRATLGRIVMTAMRAGLLTPTAKQRRIVSELAGVPEAELARVLREPRRPI